MPITSTEVTQPTGTNLHLVVDSGTITVGNASIPVTQSGAWSVTATQATGTNLHTVVDSGSITVTQATGSNLHMVVDSGTITANIGTTNGLALDATVAKLTIAQGAALGTNTLALIGGSVTTASPAYTTGQISPLSLDTTGALRVNVTAGATSGTVAQGSTTAGQSGNFIQAAVTTAAPAYTTGQTSPLSLTTTGSLRIDNSSWIGSTAPTVGQKTMANSVPVVIASDNGLIVAQGSTTSGQSGQLVMGAVTTAAPAYTTAQSSPISLDTTGNIRIQMASWIGSTAPTVGSKTSANSVPVVIASDQGAVAVTAAQATAANLNAQVVGNVASGAADSGNPVKQGFVGVTALPTAVTNGQRANGISDKFGREVVVLGTVRDLKGTQTTTISASTTETTIVTAGGAGVFNDPIAILVANTSTATSTRIDFRDATAGTIRFSMQCPANQTTGFVIPGESIPQTTAAANWTAQCATSTTDVRIYVVYEKNQ
jgi:hypothetical protein